MMAPPFWRIEKSTLYKVFFYTNFKRYDIPELESLVRGCLFEFGVLNPRHLVDAITHMAFFFFLH